MAYHVEFADRAARDLESLYMEKNAAESEAASRLYNGLEAAVYALATYPHRCAVAPEARKLRRELRHLLYGKKPHVYRVYMKSISVDRPSGCSRFVTARGERLRRPILNEARNSSLRKYM
jgi:plasmid stabilization system protein ParE